MHYLLGELHFLLKNTIKFSEVYMLTLIIMAEFLDMADLTPDQGSPIICLKMGRTIFIQTFFQEEYLKME